MKTLCSILATIAIVVSSCSAPEAEPAPPAPPQAQDQNKSRCYLGVSISADGSIRDSMSLTLRAKVDTVVGRMDWNPQEKDRLRGHVLGRIAGERIDAVLTYRAEGEEAKEERSFLVENGDLVELEGERHLVDGIWKFKTPGSLKRGMVLKAIDCQAAGQPDRTGR